MILSANTLLAGELGSIRLMQAVNRESPDFNMITSAIESDVTLSLETIRLANSAYFGRSRTISSIRQAVVALGIEGVRKWIYLSSLRRLGTGKPDILVTTSIIRSKFMELIAGAMGNAARSPEYSMLGLFSLLDAICNVPFNTLLSELNISEEIKDVLITRQRHTALGMACHTMLAYEKGKWEHAAMAAGKLGMTLDTVAQAYIDALHWYNEFMLISAA